MRKRAASVGVAVCSWAEVDRSFVNEPGSTVYAGTLSHLAP